MAADHLQFLKDKFITDFTEAVGKFEQIPQWSSFQEIREVLQEMTIGPSTPIVMKNCLYDLRYLLAECLLFAEKEMERATKKKKSHFSAYYLKKLLFLRKIEKKLQQIKQKLQCFSNGAAVGRTMLSNCIQFDEPVCAPAGVPPLDASRVHGLDEQLQRMVELLLKTPDDDGFKAIGITGMIGVGKSTLAKLVCHSSKVQKSFSPIIWLRLSEQAGPREVVKHLLLRLGAECELVYCSALSVQLRELSDQLSGKKYLIVLDNVWVLNDWYSDLGSNQDTDSAAWVSRLSSGLPKRGGGTIIVTSRCHGVARSMVGEQSILKLQPLFNAEAIWPIFMDSVHQKTFITSDHLPTLIRMKDEIVYRCDGLPLAAKILAEVISVQMGKKTVLVKCKSGKEILLETRPI